MGLVCPGSPHHPLPLSTSSPLAPSVPLEGMACVQNVLTLVRRTSCRTIAIREREGSAKTAGDSQPMSRVRGSVDGKSLRGDIKDDGVLAKAT